MYVIWVEWGSWVGNNHMLSLTIWCGENHVIIRKPHLHDDLKCIPYIWKKRMRGEVCDIYSMRKTHSIYVANVFRRTDDGISSVTARTLAGEKLAR